MTNLVLLGVEVFFAAVANGATFEHLEWRSVDAVIRAERRRQQQAYYKSSPPAHLQELGQNVGSIWPLVWPEKLPHRGMRKLHQVRGNLMLSVAPGEVC